MWGEREGLAAGTVTPAARLHGRRRGILRRAWYGLRSTVFPNRGHQELVGKQGISSSPIRRPEERAEAAVAMAGDKSSSTHPKIDIQATKCQGKWSGRERGERGFSPRGKRRRRRLAHGGSRERCGGCRGFLDSSKCEKGAGKGSKGSGEGLCSLFVETGGAGRDTPTSGSGRGGCVMDWAQARDVRR